MVKIIGFLIVGIAFIIDACLRYTSLGVDYLIDSLLLGWGLESFLVINPKDTLIFVVNLLIGILLVRHAVKSYLNRRRETVEEQPKEYTLSCSDCKQCYPNCPLNTSEDEISEDTFKLAFYNYEGYRKPESNRLYKESLNNLQNSKVHDRNYDLESYEDLDDEDDYDWSDGRV